MNSEIFAMFPHRLLRKLLVWFTTEYSFWNLFYELIMNVQQSLLQDREAQIFQYTRSNHPRYREYFYGPSKGSRVRGGSCQFSKFQTRYVDKKRGDLIETCNKNLNTIATGYIDDVDILR